MTLECEITPSEFVARRKRGDDVVLFDCRTEEERAIATIPTSIHTPLSDLKSMLQDLLVHADQTVVVHCHHGVRSLQATLFLRTEGFDDAYSLEGGIDRWSTDVDTTVPRY